MKTLIRSDVMAFAQMMEAKLRKHDDAHGTQWKKADIADLFRSLEEHCDKLEYDVRHPVPGRLGASAADVGNIAMMIADVAGALHSPPCGDRLLNHVCVLSIGHAGSHRSAREAPGDIQHEWASTRAGTVAQDREPGDSNYVQRLERFRTAVVTHLGLSATTEDEHLIDELSVLAQAATAYELVKDSVAKVYEYATGGACKNPTESALLVIHHVGTYIDQRVEDAVRVNVEKVLQADKAFVGPPPIGGIDEASRESEETPAQVEPLVQAAAQPVDATAAVDVTAGEEESGGGADEAEVPRVVVTKLARAFAELSAEYDFLSPEFDIVRAMVVFIFARLGISNEAFHRARFVETGWDRGDDRARAAVERESRRKDLARRLAAAATHQTPDDIVNVLESIIGFSLDLEQRLHLVEARRALKKR